MDKVGEEENEVAESTDTGSGEGVSAATALHQVRPDWLALTREAAIAPDLPIIDAHHHLWDVPGNRYLLDDFLADTGGGHNIVGSIYVHSGTMLLSDGPEALRSVGETHFAAGVATDCSARGSKTAVAAGIVGSVDLALGAEAGRVLDAHMDAARGRLRGVRGVTHWHDDGEIHRIATTKSLLATAPARAAIEAVRRRELVLDVWVYHTQLEEIVAVARAFPGLAIVVDHAGTPLGCGRYRDQRAAVMGAWRDSLRVLATMPNVSMKIGGLAMRFSGFGFDHGDLPPTSEMLANAWRPYVETCIDTFGPSRCMFESNFPVDKASCSYDVLWNSFKRLCAGASDTERHDLFAGTAARVYALSVA